MLVKQSNCFINKTENPFSLQDDEIIDNIDKDEHQLTFLVAILTNPNADFDNP